MLAKTRPSGYGIHGREGDDTLTIAVDDVVCLAMPPIMIIMIIILHHTLILYIIINIIIIIIVVFCRVRVTLEKHFGSINCLRVLPTSSIPFGGSSLTSMGASNKTSLDYDGE